MAKGSNQTALFDIATGLTTIPVHNWDERFETIVMHSAMLHFESNVTS